MNDGRELPPVAIPPLDGEVLLAPSARASAADDFGHVVKRTPLAVVKPGTVDDVAATIRWASTTGGRLPPVVRGTSVEVKCGRRRSRCSVSRRTGRPVAGLGSRPGQAQAHRAGGAPIPRYPGGPVRA